MTRADANLAIATALEPVATGWYPSNGGRWISKKGCWTCSDTFTIRKSPVDFFTDENASGRLLEAMPQPTLEKVASNDESMPSGDFNWFCFHDCDAAGVSAKSKDRKTAIVLAAMRWLHIDGTIEE